MDIVIENTFQARYYAEKLMREVDEEHAYGITNSLMSSDIEINPHQINTAIFAYKKLADNNPESIARGKGVILADEVGLGKTIEAGLVIKQYYLERANNIIVICPASLRKQWAQELEEKFKLPTQIIDANSMKKKLTLIRKRENEVKPKQKLNKEVATESTKPKKIRNKFFIENAKSKTPSILILSYHYAANIYSQLEAEKWNLVVFDEAHKLSSVYKEDKYIATRIQSAFAGKKKILLTATPFQNNLLELYGLASFISPDIFPSLKFFQRMYIFENNIKHLKEKLAQFCIRTLRKDVTDYIRYTSRYTLLHEYKPTKNELLFMEGVTAFIQLSSEYSMLKRNKGILKVLLLKTLSSSIYAALHFLKKLLYNIEGKHQSSLYLQESLTAIFEEEAAEIDNIEAELPDISHLLALEQSSKLNKSSEPVLYEDEDGLDYAFLNAIEAMGNEEEENPLDDNSEALLQLEKEIEELKILIDLGESLVVDTKAKTLLTALDNSKKELQKHEANNKILIFTESRRTQDFLYDFLSKHGYEDKIVLFNGTNNDSRSNAIYEEWKTRQGNQQIYNSNILGKNTEMRHALLEYFKESAEIMIATEAAAEGLNLQFCSLIINYDLPWNPQRIEQRIGRCHRYGQKNDVVVINFLNTKNYADMRVYELLSEKFHLFKGVLGSSDSVIGTLGEGIDFEREILGIYQQCKTKKEIKSAFDSLQNRIEKRVTQEKTNAVEKLFSTFSKGQNESIQKQIEEKISEKREILWKLLCFFLKNEKLYSKKSKNTLIFENSFIIHDEEHAITLTNDIGHIRQGKYLVDFHEKNQNYSEEKSFRLDFDSPLVNYFIEAIRKEEKGDEIVLYTNKKDYNIRSGTLFIHETSLMFPEQAKQISYTYSINEWKMCCTYLISYHDMIEMTHCSHHKHFPSMRDVSYSFCNSYKNMIASSQKSSKEYIEKIQKRLDEVSIKIDEIQNLHIELIADSYKGYILNEGKYSLAQKKYAQLIKERKELYAEMAQEEERYHQEEAKLFTNFASGMKEEDTKILYQCDFRIEYKEEVIN